MKTITRTYQNPRTFGQNALTFTANGRSFLVVHHTAAGEDIAPDAYRFDNIDAARRMWAKLETVIKSRGYQVKSTK